MSALIELYSSSSARSIRIPSTRYIESDSHLGNVIKGSDSTRPTPLHPPCRSLPQHGHVQVFTGRTHSECSLCSSCSSKIHRRCRLSSFVQCSSRLSWLFRLHSG